MASVRERVTKSGERTWAVLYRHGNRQTSRTFGDARSAEKFRKLVEAMGPDRALTELLTDDQPQGVTVDELAAGYLEWQESRVTQRTLNDYRRDYGNWIKPWFGHRAASSIDEADVQKWVDHMAKTLAPKSVADRHMVLHSIFKWGKAKTRRLVDDNPCTETEMPRAAKKPPKGTTVPEWRAMLGAAEDRNPDARDLILFLGSLGWRWSEAAALAVRDIEDDGEAMHVNVTRVFRVIDNGQVLVEDAAKSWAGFRRVPVPNSEARTMLRRRIVGKAPGDYVFTNSRGGYWRQNTFLRNTWPGILEAADLGERKPTPHWLRHMAVAVLAAGGATAIEIQRYIGHEDISTTIGTYGGMIGGLNADVLTNVDRILSGQGPRGHVVSGEVVRQAMGQLG
ncbi:MAG: hypothetical protein CMJ18_07840 [Phycisphaeraceae bacterium]|nr:hypothetical protein [Phycisphaeraceae bacterium]